MKGWLPGQRLSGNGNQSRQAGVVAGTGVAPMNRLIDVAALHRVEVDVLQFLSHHLVALDQLRMTPLLPELVLPVRLVTRLLLGELLQERDVVLLFEQVDDLSRGE